MPFFGVCIYYLNTVKYYTNNYIEYRIIQLLILTVIIPILCFRVLLKLGLVDSIMVKNVSQRKAPYLISLILNAYIGNFVFKESPEIELKFFFLAISATSLLFYVFTLFKFKASLHMAAIGGLTIFVFMLSSLYQINLNLSLGVLIIFIGLVGTSRLYLKAHTLKELAVGLCFGIVPQALLVLQWN